MDLDKMKISIISNYTFASSLPEDLTAVHQYGSESMSAVLAQQLSKTHEVVFYAPVGSSRVGQYHPTKRTDGKYLQSDLLEDISINGQRHQDLLDSFVIDMTPWANNIIELATYNDFRNYLSYRLGYNDYIHPNIDPALRHHITHCKYFADLYEKAGYPGCQVARFGINDFWNPESIDSPYLEWIKFWKKLTPKQYFLFPHRYNIEKGSRLVLKLASEFPKETFVFSSAAVLPDHVAARDELKTESVRLGLTNVKFIDFPSSPDREFYRRELYRNAKCTLSPFIPNVGYHDTGGILSMESIKCGTPVIVTRSPGSEEILGHQEDKAVFFSDGYESLKLLVEYMDFLGVIPEPWKWTTDLYVKEYMSAIENIIN